MEAVEVETRQLLQKLFPKVSLPSNVVRQVALPALCLGDGELWSCCIGQSGAISHSPICPKDFAVGHECLLLVLPVLARSKGAKLQTSFKKSVKTNKRKAIILLGQ